MAWRQFSPCICNAAQSFLSKNPHRKTKPSWRRYTRGGPFNNILHQMKIHCWIKIHGGTQERKRCGVVRHSICENNGAKLGPGGRGRDYRKGFSNTLYPLYSPYYTPEKFFWTESDNKLGLVEEGGRDDHKGSPQMIFCWTNSEKETTEKFSWKLS